MGEVGRFDFDLFRAYRRAPRRNALFLNRLIRENEPLLKVLTAQLMGRPPKDAHARTMRNRLRVPYAEDLPWEEALNAARVALLKALRPGGFNPAKGKLSWYLKLKIRHELQELVQRESLVKIGRDQAPASAEYYEDEDHLGRLTRDALEGLDQVDGEDLDDVVTVEQLEDAIDIRLSVAEPEPPPPPRDLRPALVVLLEEHLRFARLARAPASAVHGRLETLARSRGEYIARGALARALLERNVPRITMRVAWSSSPVEAFAGIALQATSRAPLRQTPTEALQDEARNPRRFLASGHGG